LCDSNYSGTYESWHEWGLKCKPVFKYVARDNRWSQRIAINAHGDGDTGKDWFDDCW